jgi:hypothetical protein
MTTTIKPVTVQPRLYAKHLGGMRAMMCTVEGLVDVTTARKWCSENAELIAQAKRGDLSEDEREELLASAPHELRGRMYRRATQGSRERKGK